LRCNVDFCNATKAELPCILCMDVDPFVVAMEIREN
jgi:hypothetical protein